MYQCVHVPAGGDFLAVFVRDLTLRELRAVVVVGLHYPPALGRSERLDA